VCPVLTGEKKRCNKDMEPLLDPATGKLFCEGGKEFPDHSILTDITKGQMKAMGQVVRGSRAAPQESGGSSRQSFAGQTAKAPRDTVAAPKGEASLSPEGQTLVAAVKKK